MMLKVLVSVFLVLALTSESLAGHGRRGKGKRHRGCGHGGESEEREGQRFKWNVTGLDSDDLRVTYREGAFAPEGNTVVHKYPLDRGQRALGVVPAKMFYDFSGPEPVAVLRTGKRGRGSCIVVNADVDTYDELITRMEERNMSNTDMPTEEEAVRLTATLTTDDSQFSATVRDMCSKDKCGRPVEPVYYVTQLAADDAEDEDEAVALAEAEPGAVAEVFEPSFVLFDTRYTISGMPDPRQQRRWQRRQDRRHGRRQNRGRQNETNGANSDRDARREGRRHQRRQERRERKRQGGASAE